jgi:hypothetical protein
MRRRLNFRFLPYLLVVCAVAGLATRQLHAWQVRRNARARTVLFHLPQASQQAKNKRAASRTFLQAKEKGLTPADRHPLGQSG